MEDKENQTHFSIDAMKRHLEALKTHPELGKFVIQQYKIQQLLFSIILYRLAEKNLNTEWLDKNEKILNKINNYSLGQLCGLYKPHTNKAGVDEAKLYKKLNKYFKKRNEVIHKQHKFKASKNQNLNNLKDFTAKMIVEGSVIDEELSKLLSSLYNERLS